MLKVSHLKAHYGDVQVLHGVDLEIRAGEIVALVGANAAGKTTLLNAICRQVRRTEGSIELDGVRIDQLRPHAVVEHGIVQVPEGRRLFPFMTVLENLEMGAFAPTARPKRHATLAAVFELLPVLKERRHQLAGSLSGGEQQMCAIARGLMAQPRLLMLDEPSLGLAPMMVERVLQLVKELNARGTTVLLVEQKVLHSLKTCHRGYVLENGRVALSGSGSELLADERLRKAYMGM